MTEHSQVPSKIIARRHGRGPAMVLIHGVGMCADFWRSIESDLCDGYSLTVIDMPGHGDCQALPQTNPVLSDYTDAIATVFHAIGEPAIVVGHSMGALIALDLAVRYPARVAGIAVLNGVYRRSADAQTAINERVAQLEAASSVDSSLKQQDDSSATLARWFGDNPQGIEAKASHSCRRLLAAMDPAGYLSAYRAFAAADAPDDRELRQIACSALFLTGSLEPNSTPDMSRQMSALVTDSTCKIIGGARHMTSMTHPIQTTRALRSAFESATDGPCGNNK